MKNLLVTLADKNYITPAKQLFSSVYWNAGWDGDYMLLAYGIPEGELKWFGDKGILVKRLKPFHGEKKESSPAINLSKCYLFTPEFKEWKNIIFLDADIIIRASLDELANVKGFAAKREARLDFEFIKPNPLSPNRKSRQIIRKSFGALKKNYNLRESAFNTGVMAFSTDIIEEGTFSEIKRLFELYGVIARCGEESILNLLFYKNLIELPYVSNCWPDYMRWACNIRPEEIKAIILHFMARNKPWLAESPFYKEWKENLDKAEMIDLKKIPLAREIWSEGEIGEYCRYLRTRHVLYFYKDVMWRSWIFMDRIYGFVTTYLGIYLRKNFPGIYTKLKKFEKILKGVFK